MIYVVKWLLLDKVQATKKNKTKKKRSGYVKTENPTWLGVGNKTTWLSLGNKTKCRTGTPVS